ncbi:MAG: hypothetical protein GX644_11730 [Limnobacter sp.]|nr:hypothetical protein [Limnobacter sp.]
MTALSAPTIDQVAPGLTTRVKDGDLRGTRNALLGVSVIALVASIVPMLAEGEARRTALASYLTAYMFTLGTALGALFFVLIHHLTRAGWSVVVRRISENMAATLFPWLAVLFLPLAIWHHDVWHHWMVEGVTDPAAPNYDAVIAGKSAYLNVPFFFIRAGVYFAVWALLAHWFRNSSLAQDQDGDPARSLKMARRSAPAMLAFALTTTFAAFDWIMSLDPHWFSTIFGVVYFAGGVVAMYATLALFAMWLGRHGYLREVVNAEHYHDIGKLLFAFMVFWAYTSFSQYMLIWYANLPEETGWFATRSEGSWNTVFTVLAFGHFLAPLAFLMSRHTKRRQPTLAIAAVFMLVMHWFDMAYQIMPSMADHGAGDGHAHAGFTLHWTDPVALIGIYGLFLAMSLRNVIGTPLIPERDPRLAESMHFHNV